MKEMKSTLNQSITYREVPKKDGPFLATLNYKMCFQAFYGQFPSNQGTPEIILPAWPPEWESLALPQSGSLLLTDGDHHSEMKSSS